MSVLHSMKLGIDINRQKEVIAKAVSAVLLLLLKHLKLNHVYQFEFVSQHLVFANCIPLVLKFINQDIVQYVTAKNRYGVYRTGTSGGFEWLSNSALPWERFPLFTCISQ